MKASVKKQIKDINAPDGMTHYESSPRTFLKYRISEEDLCHYLQTKLVMKEDGQGLPYRIIKQFVDAVFLVIGDLLVERANIAFDGFGKIVVNDYPQFDNVSVRVQLDKELKRRMLDDTKAIEEESLIDIISKQRNLRLAENARQKYYRDKRKETDKDNTDL